MLTENNKIKDNMKTSVLATFPGMVLTITTGAAVIGGTILYTAELMKMHVEIPSQTSGFFEASVSVGATVLVGKTIGHITTMYQE